MNDNYPTMVQIQTCNPNSETHFTVIYMKWLFFVRFT